MSDTIALFDVPMPYPFKKNSKKSSRKNVIQRYYFVEKRLEIRVCVLYFFTCIFPNL